MNIHSVNARFCRINYIARVDYHYCLQEDGEGNFVLYRCSQDWEHDYSVSGDYSVLEIPTGNSEFELAAAKWIEECNAAMQVKYESTSNS